MNKAKKTEMMGETAVSRTVDKTESLGSQSDGKAAFPLKRETEGDAIELA